jgi:hypothetical protein
MERSQKSYSTEEGLAAIGSVELAGSATSGVEMPTEGTVAPASIPGFSSIVVADTPMIALTGRSLMEAARTG